jgi:type IV secretion system protein VirB4
MFFGIFVPLAIVGIILYAMWKEGPGFQKEYRDRDIGFADMLRYNRMVKDGVCLCKGGELMAGFWFRGVDLDSSSNEQIVAMMSRINSAFAKFNSGWMAHIDAIRTHKMDYFDKGEFFHPILELMDGERRAQFNSEGNHYDGQYAITLTWKPPSIMDAKAASMLYEHSDDRITGNLEAKTLRQFEDRIKEFEGAMRGMFHDVRRMGYVGKIDRPSLNGKNLRVDDFSSYLHYCATGITQALTISSSTPADIDVLVGSQDFVGGNTPIIGKNHIRLVYIEGYPTEAAPLVLELLNRLRVTYRWSTRFIFFDPEEAKNVISRIRKKWRQKLRPVADQVFNRQGGVIDQDALKMALDAEQAYAEAGSGMIKNGHYTSVVVLMDENEDLVIDQAKYMKQAIEDIGFACRIEDVNAVEAFLGSLPGHGYENVRRPVMHTMNLAYLFPATAIWSGPETHPCKFYPPNSPPLFMAESSGGTPFRGVLHVGDVGHGFLVGPTGAGKSTILQFLISQHFRYRDSRALLFEKGYSGYALASGISGKHYDIGGEGTTTAYAPLADIDKPTERAWAEDWLCVLAELQGQEITPNKRKTIREALNKTASSDDKEQWTMTHLVGHIQDADLGSALEFYTVDGSSAYLDAKPSEENISFARYSVFEMEHLMEMGEKHVVPILLYLFHKIEKSLRGEPVLLVLDEAWLMLNHPLFQERIKKWLKTMRKANVAVWFATQELADFAKSNIRDVIFASCPTRIYLPNPDALRPSVAALYADLGLNKQQIDLIAMGTPKRDYYYSSPYGSRLFSLALGALNLALTGVSGKDEYRQIRELQEKLGERWVIEWIRKRAGSIYAEAANSALYKRAA